MTGFQFDRQAGSDRSPRVLFVDQTGQLGGAEFALLEIVGHRRKINPGGSGDHVMLLGNGPFADRLRDEGIDVSVCPLADRSNQIDKSAGLIGKVLAASDIFRVARQVRRLAADHDVIYANTAKSLVIAGLTRRLSRRTKPLVYHLHDILSLDHFSRSNQRLLVMLANRADAVIANSDATAEAFVEAGGDERRVTVVANGIDFRPFDRVADGRAEHRARIRSQLGVDEQDLVGLFGRLSPWKGQHLAIEAISTMPNVHLALVGDALFGETEYAEGLREQTRRLRLTDRVHFLGFRSDVAELMAGCDVVLHASVAPEPFGRIIVEAMVSERPVVVANAGGAAKIVDHGRTGWLYTPGDVSALRSALRLAQSETTSAVLSAAAGEARQRFNQADRADDVCAVIQRVGEGSNGLGT